MPDTDGIYIGRTAKNQIRLTAQKGDDQLCFTVDANVAQTLVSELQSEIARAQNEGAE